MINMIFLQKLILIKTSKAVGIDFNFIQDNQSLSAEAGVLRGLHFQRGKYIHKLS